MKILRFMGDTEIEKYTIRPYGYNIDVRLLFRRFYCSKCGEKLKAQKVVSLSLKEELFYSECYKHNYLKPEMYALDKVLVCPECGNHVIIGEQLKIAKLQKKSKTKIITEINQDNNCYTKEKIKKQKNKATWLFLFSIFAHLLFFVSFFTINFEFYGIPFLFFAILRTNALQIYLENKAKTKQLNKTINENEPEDIKRTKAKIKEILKYATFQFVCINLFLCSVYLNFNPKGIIIAFVTFNAILVFAFLRKLCWRLGEIIDYKRYLKEKEHEKESNF